MGVNIEFAGGRHGPGATDFCTNGGLGALYDWIGGLPAGAYPALSRLREDGHATDTAALAVELDDALASRPPDDPDVAGTAERLADLIGTGDEAETVVISEE